jgi:hypothetical protein
MSFRRFAVSGADWLGKSDGRPMPGRRLRRIGGKRVWCIKAALVLAFIFLFSAPLAKEAPSIVMVKARRAQEIVDQLRAALPISSAVEVVVVNYHPLVFSVEAMDKRKEKFLLSMEFGFLLRLDDDELRAALAHELGHVWIYTHHPYLQTERLANLIGERVADRAAFEKVYSKLWTYEGTSGVPLDDLLGPSSRGVTGSAAVSGDRP